MKKKFLSVLLVLVMVFTMIPMATGVAWAALDVGQSFYTDANGANATNTSTDMTFKFTVTTGDEVKVHKANNSISGSVTIPATVTYDGNTYNVTSIATSGFASCQNLTSITIPNSVKSIGGDAFRECSKLATVTNSANITSIASNTFLGCASLTSITIPASVASIGDSAFYNCSSLATVTFVDGQNLELTSINEKTFYGCTSLTSITIPARVASIGDSAFYNCSSLATVTFAGGQASQLKEIGQGAFYKCGLTNIKIPASVTNINVFAFANCTSLTAFTVEQSNTSYIADDGVLYNYSKTELVQYPAGKSDNSFVVPNSITKIEGNAFNGCLYLKTVTFAADSKLTHINDNAFNKCTSLESITIPASVESIGQSAFCSCSKLTSVNFASESKLKTIEASTFESCNKLENIIIPASVKSIGYGAFQGCTSLTNITIPASTTFIDSNAFNGCSQLATVTCLATIPPTLGEHAFYEEGVPKSGIAIYVPYESVDAYKTADKWSTYANIIQAIPEPEPQTPSISYFVYDVAQYNAILAEAQRQQALIDAQQAGTKPAEPTTEPTAEKLTVSEAKDLVETMVPTVRTENQARGIKVFVKDSEEVAKFKAAGYKVLYDFYRAESKAVPKASDYKITTVVNKEEPWYLNTAAKKGKKYYYKAVAKVYDANGELVAETELTQGKYGCRTR